MQENLERFPASFYAPRKWIHPPRSFRKRVEGTGWVLLAKASVAAMRAQAEKDFPQGMSLDEINEEIRKVRYGKGD